MIPRIKKMSVLDDYILFVEFDDGYKVLYDVKDDIIIKIPVSSFLMIPNRKIPAVGKASYGRDFFVKKHI